MNYNNAIGGKNKILSFAKIASNVILASSKNGFIVIIVSLVTKAVKKFTFIVNSVRNAIKDPNRIHIIVLLIINVILVLRNFFNVKYVMAVIKDLKKNIFIVINAGNATLDKNKTISISEEKMFASII